MPPKATKTTPKPSTKPTKEKVQSFKDKLISMTKQSQNRYSRYELDDICESIKTITNTINELEQLNMNEGLKENAKRCLEDILKSILHEYGIIRDDTELYSDNDTSMVQVSEP